MSLVVLTDINKPTNFSISESLYFYKLLSAATPGFQTLVERMAHRNN